MTTASILAKEKIVSLSELQKNPSKALTGDIIRIVKNGKEIGIFMSKAEFEDFMEETMPLKPTFEKELKKVVAKSKKSKLCSLKELV